MPGAGWLGQGSKEHPPAGKNRDSGWRGGAWEGSWTQDSPLASGAGGGASGWCSYPAALACEASGNYTFFSFVRGMLQVGSSSQVPGRSMMFSKRVIRKNGNRDPPGTGNPSGRQQPAGSPPANTVHCGGENHMRNTQNQFRTLNPHTRSCAPKGVLPGPRDAGPPTAPALRVQPRAPPGQRINGRRGAFFFASNWKQDACGNREINFQPRGLARRSSFSQESGHKSVGGAPDSARPWP